METVQKSGGKNLLFGLIHNFSRFFDKAVDGLKLGVVGFVFSLDSFVLSRWS